MNMKSFLNFKKYALLVAVALVASITISSCDDDDDDGGPAVFDGTVAELIQANEYKQSVNGDPLKSFDSLVKYLTKYPSLVSVASGSTDLTLFAPNNQAFINLLATPGFPSNIEDISPSLIQGVLAYHVVVGQKLSKANLTPTGTGAGFTSAYSQADNCNPTAPGVAQVIKVNANGTLLTGSTNQDIDITTPDLLAENGAVHIVESVMIPPSIGASLTPILGRLSGTVLLATDFTYLAALVTYADCAFTETTTDKKLATILSNPATSYTVFFPANAYFTTPTAQGGAGYNSPTQAIAALGTPAQVRAVILNHVLVGSFTAAQLTADITAGGGSATKTAVGGATLTFTGGNFPGTTTPTIFVRGTNCTLNLASPVAVADISHSNGVGHAIFGVITVCP
jgi:uncharacterized surface protein with fasciclin (FAS1) repeats